MKYTLLTLVFALSCAFCYAQTGTIKGNIFDKETGEPLLFGNIYLEGTSLGANTDGQGFYTIRNIPVGEYLVVATYIGYDSASTVVSVASDQIILKNLFLTSSGIELGVVNISSQREKAKNEVQVSAVTITTRQIKALPSAGGEPDIAQYLQVLPGVIFTGDQGGQLYIRGGSPIQNKVLLDGMTIYNPFHSIGFFSVFETEAIRTADVLTGGFNAEHGGRISAVVDIKTREGNKKRIAGLVSASPFQAKALIEGPIVPFEEGKASVSFLLTAKKSLIDRTSKTLYEYASPDENGIPFSFEDYYGKISFVAPSGSKLNLFGFNFQDAVDFTGVSDLDWKSTGGGMNFKLIPLGSNIVVDGIVAFSNYDLKLEEADENPRTSGVNGFNVGLNFSSFGLNNQIDYGIEINGFTTDFQFTNFLDQTINQKQNTTELAAFVKYKQKFGNLVFEPGVRVQYYASLNETSVEPRIGLKYNISEKIRVKLGAGIYSQNLISTTSDLDVVNLFQGFLSGPESRLFKLNSDEPTDTRLQKATHAVFGVELDLSPSMSLNVEPYYKRYNQLIALNRNKLSGAESNFMTEEGDAYGIDFLLKYDQAPFFFWATYSLGRVERYDGTQTYPTSFDRRHNVNLLASYQFGSDRSWELGARWNLGSGFPFTRTQGFYGEHNFTDDIDIDIVTENPDLGVILEEQRNAGRLPYYHRLDMSMKKWFEFGDNIRVEANVSVTNAYDRENIFFFDRVRLERVDQLPILPSAGIKVEF